MQILSSRIGRIRLLLAIFMAGLVISGLTAIPLQWEVEILRSWLGSGTRLVELFPALSAWIDRVAEGVRLGYGTDWLAFGHVVIAAAFIGPLRDPARNRWVIEFGMLACALVIPWTLIFGPLRGIPFFWMLGDMSFGVFGLAPLWLAHRQTLALAREP